MQERARRSTPNFEMRDLAGLIGVLILALGLIVVAFLSHAGPLILIAVLLLLIFGLLRVYREKGRKEEAREVTQALRTRLQRGEKLLACTVGDRRRWKPITTLTDFALMMFTQGLAAGATRSAVGIDDTCVGLTDRRLIAIDRQRRQRGRRRGWREWLKLGRMPSSKGRHVVIFEAPRGELSLSIGLALFYLARMRVRVQEERGFSLGINSRYWAERAVELQQQLLLPNTREERVGG